MSVKPKPRNFDYYDSQKVASQDDSYALSCANAWQEERTFAVQRTLSADESLSKHHSTAGLQLSLAHTVLSVTECRDTVTFTVMVTP
jgi:hypothetical protein